MEDQCVFETKYQNRKVGVFATGNKEFCVKYLSKAAKFTVAHDFGPYAETQIFGQYIKSLQAKISSLTEEVKFLKEDIESWQQNELKDYYDRNDIPDYIG